MTVSVTVKPRMYLYFPDLDPDMTFKPAELQIGHCYMPPRFEAENGSVKNDVSAATAAPETDIVRRLRVRNVTDHKLFLSCIPNLRKQCFVYADIPTPTSSAAAAAAGTTTHRPLVADLPLLPQSETTLYIGLRPVLPSEAYVTG